MRDASAQKHSFTAYGSWKACRRMILGVSGRTAVWNRLVAAPIIEQIFNNAIEPPIIVGISSEKLLKIFNDFKMVVIPLIAAYTGKMKMDIGKQIRALRLAKGVTQEELAEYLGVSFQAQKK